LKAMGQEGVQLLLSDVKDEALEKLGMEMADEAVAPMVDPKPLTGSPVEAHQEQYNEYNELELSRIGATSNGSRAHTACPIGLPKYCVFVEN
jgi:hypothetical protein